MWAGGAVQLEQVQTSSWLQSEPQGPRFVVQNPNETSMGPSGSCHILQMVPGCLICCSHVLILNKCIIMDQF